MKTTLTLAILMALFLTVSAQVWAYDGEISYPNGEAPSAVVTLEGEQPATETTVATQVITETTVATAPAEQMPVDVTAAPIDATPYYQTRDGHDEAARRVLSGKFPGKIEADTVEAKIYIRNGRRFIVDSVTGKVLSSQKLAKVKAKPSVIAIAMTGLKKSVGSMLERLAGLESSDKEQNSRLDKVEERVGNIETDVATLKTDVAGATAQAADAANKVGNVRGAAVRATAVGWIALILAVIAFLVAWRRRGTRPDYRSKPEVASDEEIERLRHPHTT